MNIMSSRVSQEKIKELASVLYRDSHVTKKSKQVCLHFKGIHAHSLADRLCRHFQTSLSEVRSSLKGEIPAVDGGLADIKATVCCPQTHSTEDSLKRNNSVTPDRTELNWTTGMWCTIYFHLRLHWKSVFKDKDLVSHCLVLCFILERWHAKDTLFCVRSKYRLFYYIH